MNLIKIINIILYFIYLDFFKHWKEIITIAPIATSSLLPYKTSITSYYIFSLYTDVAACQ